ncbi:MAG TPA: NAD(P)-dependent oxidoreductase [Streptosporangiaceae bacterium]|nr:NAD(P)-dependent oxidoreductase [Streptosporangiaceae bacterium]
MGGKGADMSIAVLGMGLMGSALAGRLLDGGHQVTVWNRSKGKAGEVVSAGAREAASVTDAVRDADIVITMLADDDAVRAVALGELRGSIGDQAVYVNTSTVSPALNSELAKAFPGRFLALLVLGSPDSVRTGQAAYLVGDDGSVADRLAPVMSSLSASIHRYHTPFLATTAKLASNLLLLTQIAALAESFAVGRSGGLSDEQLRELLGSSPMVAPGIKNRFEAVLTGAQDGWWTTVLGAKDAGLAISLAQAANVELPEAEAVKRLYDQAAASGFDHADIAAVSDLYRHPASATP